MHILGISCYFHDAAAALLRDGDLVAAALEERFSRRKHDAGFPERAIEFCLGEGSISRGELDYVVFYEKPLRKFDRILKTTLSTFPRSRRVFTEGMIEWFGEKLWVRSRISEFLDLPEDRVLFVDHHLSHAASAFFCSPFQNAAVLTCDGVGEWTTTALGTASGDWGDGNGNRIELTHEITFPHSLGLLYSAFTAYLGFRVNSGEYKVMGMASYGRPRYVDELHDLIRIESDGSFALDLDFFEFHRSTSRSYSARFEAKFGPPRDPDVEFFTTATHPERDGAIARRNQHYADLAASLQRVTEECLLTLVNQLHRSTGARHLCMAGGVALNSVANGRIAAEGPFEDMYVQPAAGDAGGALGAALYAHHVLLGRPRHFTLEHGYWGGRYEPEAALRERAIAYRTLGEGEAVVERVASALERSEVVGWFQGRSEWGPRALGHRSILADPRDLEMKEVVNRRVKFRETFRPFAPTVLDQQADRFFDIPGDPSRHLSRFMLSVARVRPDAREEIPAVTHVDGSARVQTLRDAWDPLYARLLARFEEIAGVPVLLNTSFNRRGEPIVETPAEAIEVFLASDLDMLVLGPHVIAKGSR